MPHNVEQVVKQPANKGFVVIGGGVAGVSTALFLAEAGIATVLCEKGRIAGLVLAAGLSGHGLGLGPGAGMLAAQLISGATPIVEYDGISPVRFRSPVGFISKSNIAGDTSRVSTALSSFVA